MRIYMQTPPEAGGSPRFYQLQLQQDMFGGWSVVREWGFQGASGTIKRSWHNSQDEALQTMESVRNDQLKRGYIVTFVRGNEQ